MRMRENSTKHKMLFIVQRFLIPPTQFMKHWIGTHHSVESEIILLDLDDNNYFRLPVQVPDQANIQRQKITSSAANAVRIVDHYRLRGQWTGRGSLLHWSSISVNAFFGVDYNYRKTEATHFIPFSVQIATEWGSANRSNDRLPVIIVWLRLKQFHE